MKKGFTLIEVILGMFLISLIAMAFIPMVSFSFKNIVHSQEFTRTLFHDQRDVEEEMEKWQEKDPNDPSYTGSKGTIPVFGTDITGFKIEMATTSSGEVNVFLPQRVIPDDIPAIQDAPKVFVKNKTTNAYMPPTTSLISLFDNSNKLFVKDDVTINVNAYNHLMNVYRWYLTEEKSISDKPLTNDGNNIISTDNYLVVKEWNEARKQLDFPQSLALNFIPNIKDDYNEIDFVVIQSLLSLNDEEMINRFGNRFIRYGVVPYSIIGRIGKEELSNFLYIQAPRIKIIDSEFIVGENKLKIEFDDNVLDVINIELFELNPLLGNIITITRDDTDSKVIFIEYENTVDQTSDMAGNFLRKGAVKDEVYGAISIWNNDILEGEFIIEKD